MHIIAYILIVILPAIIALQLADEYGTKYQKFIIGTTVFLAIEAIFIICAWIGYLLSFAYPWG